MNRRVLYSYVVSFLLAVLLVLLVGLWLWLAKLGAVEPPPVLSGPEAAEMDVAVVVQLPETPPAGQPVQGADPSLATEQKGKGKQPGPDEKPAETAKTESPKPAPADKNAASEARPEPSRPARAEPPKPAPTAPSAPAASKGELPPLLQTGATDLLWKKYPRLEVVWICDRTPGEGEESPRVLHEVVLDDRGRLCWHNLRTGERFGEFTLTTERYNSQGRIMAVDPSRLEIWKQREAMIRLAELPAEAGGRLSFGYYRHRAEVALLAPVQEAFRRAAAEGRVQFDPSRRDVLEVQWSADVNGEPVVGAAWFRPDAGSSIRIK